VARVVVERLQFLALLLQGGLLLQQGQSVLGGLGAGGGHLVQFAREALHLHLQVLHGLVRRWAVVAGAGHDDGWMVSLVVGGGGDGVGVGGRYSCPWAWQVNLLVVAVDASILGGIFSIQFYVLEGNR